MTVTIEYSWICVWEMCSVSQFVHAVQYICDDYMK